MHYGNELSFLCDVLKKSHVGRSVTELSLLQDRLDDASKKDLFDHNDPIGIHLPPMQPKTIYRLTDAYELCYRMLLLPATEPQTVLCVGPYLPAPISQKRLLSIGEAHGISPQKQRYLSEYYSSLPVLSDGAPILTMLNTFCERIWNSAKFAIADVSVGDSHTEEPVSRSMRNPDTNDTLVNIKALERRYAFENEMIRAVSMGQLHTETRFRASFSTSFFEKRSPDPLRNAKNYTIIMNTLLRKAAEHGGVHPFQLDQISSGFAARIEGLTGVTECASLMSEMFRTYCRAVRKHSLKQYSPIVQKIILTIDADLSADLTPSSLARGQDISAGYLSTLFKKETDSTLSAYIRERRMKYAAYLLETTSLQIQTVALHCGIMDVQYFSKLFKSHYQKTPSEYRAHIKKLHSTEDTL